MPDERSVVLPKEWQPRSACDAEVNDDMEPMLNLVEQEEFLRDELFRCTTETVNIIAALGGQANGYRRNRRRAVQRMVAEIYSAPRVTKTLKLMPSMELVPGFALDLSGEHENGNSWDFTRADMRAKARALPLDKAIPADRQSTLHSIQQLASPERGPTRLDGARRHAATSRGGAACAVLL